ncbi:MAG: hypothetical protein JWP89_3207 [Schlesneria sp.]|nr:hypothetical protein [Schlesneria sp.]
MIALWWGLISAWVLSILSVLSAMWWLSQDSGPEPLSNLFNSGSGFAFTTISLIVYWFFGEEYEAKQAAHKLKLDERVKDVLDRIEREERNFDRIHTKGHISGDLHRDAVEVASFELLESAVEPLTTAWRYRRLARRILNEIHRNQELPTGHKDVSKLIPLLAQLKKMATDA